MYHPQTPTPLSDDDGEQDTRIILARISDPEYAITLERVFTIMSLHGCVEKIVIFKNNEGPHVLVQFSDSASATSAFYGLHLQNMYVGCNQLEVGYFNRKSFPVHISGHSDHARDYTAYSCNEEYESSSNKKQNAPPQHRTGIFKDAVPITPPPSASSHGAEIGCGARVSVCGNSNPGLKRSGACKDKAKRMAFGAPNHMVTVENVEAKQCTAEMLATLLGAYGNVKSVKVLANAALVELQSEEMVANVLSFLDGCPLFSRNLKLSRGDQGYAAEDAQSVYFPHADEHRFTSLSADVVLVPPFKMLAIEGVSVCTANGDIRDMLTHIGVSCVNIEQRSPTETLVEVATDCEAVHALISTHGQELNGSKIAVSFTLH